MKATKIYYKKLFTLGNYQNEEIGIEIQIEKGDKANEVLKQAKRFVESKGDPAKLIQDYERYKKIVDFPDSYTVKEYNLAKKFLKEVNIDTELPF